MDLLAKNFPLLFITAFFAILFLQSGLDKLFHYQDNLTYFKDHFRQSPLRSVTGLLMPVITVLELLAGLVSAAVFLYILFLGSCTFGLLSPAISGLALLALFFGQRLAKDYGGAASLVPYFLVAVFGLWLFIG
ncbi:MAG: DoxX family membrane protein [Saprospiraceae bacterium]|nr:DoxX family membrane protein [Saprospiraceae bacterium]